MVLNRANTSKYIIILVIVLPFIRYYSLPVLDISIESVVVLLLFSLCLMLQKITKGEIREDYRLKNSRILFLLFSVWLLLITLFYEVGTNININHYAADYTLNTFVMYIPTVVVVYTLIGSKLKCETAFSMYQIAIYIAIAVYLVQWILVYCGIEIGFNLPFLNYSSSWSYLDGITFGMNSRPTSLFSEQAHFCEYTIPYVCICLYSEKYRYRIQKAILMSILIVSTVSGNGIVSISIAWALYILLFSKMQLYKRIAIVIIGIIAFIVIYRYLLTIATYSKMFSELFVNTTGKFTATKADYRVYRGFSYFFQLPVLQKIFGVGYQHMHAFATEFGLFSKYDSATNTFEFFSTITQILLYSGIVGGLLFFSHIYYLWKSKSYLVKGLIVVSVALWFSSQMLFANTYILYMMLIVLAFQDESGSLKPIFKNRG